MATILAIDWGKKRLGCARADTRARLPEPLATLPHTEDMLVRIRNVVDQERVTTVVVGLPRNMDGEETEQSREVRAFVTELENALQCPIVLQDETLTSHYIDDLRQQYPKADTDSLAATRILKDYLQSV